MTVTIRAVERPGDPAIAAFGRLQQRVYFEPEMLIPASYIGVMLRASTPGRHNFMLVAEHDGRVVGGSVFHRFRGPDAGFSSFMATAPEVRGQGVARQLHEARFALLDGASPRGRVSGVFIDVVAPERLTARQLETERKVGSDPARRRAVFARLGFRQVDVPYEQPVGGEGGGPVTNMDLLYCPRDTALSVKLDLVLGTMRAYWSPWLGVERTERALEELQDRAGGRAELPLLDPTSPD